MSTTHTREQSVGPTVLTGAVIGMAAAVAMAMYAMVASATYQNNGFFTPLFHISALVGSPSSMTQSMQAAVGGSTFWFTTGAAVSGLLIHMLTGAVYGIGFALAARRLQGSVLVVAGMAYGVGVLLFSGFVALPVAASLAGAGRPISDMAEMVGWATFAVEHLIYGMVLGIGVSVVRRWQRVAPAMRHATSHAAT